jgi:hypothetical protein
MGMEAPPLDHIADAREKCVLLAGGLDVHDEVPHE